jgi:predicted RNA-binding Zn-ribbon protein involved in translation (DUF1610 family)
MLLSRLHAATSSVERNDADKPLLPYDTVRDLLEGHPLVDATRVDPHDVHACLVDLHAWLATPREQEPQPPAADESPPPKCEACKCDGVLDEREGQYACEGCGAVLRGNVNVTREWIAPAQDEWRTARHPPVRGVSWHVLQASLAHVVADERQRPSELWDDLEHWNTYAHVGADDLRRWDRVLRDFAHPRLSDASHRHSALVCVVACLLYDRVRFSDVRARLRRGQPLERGDVAVPEPRFPCATCGTKVFRMRDARFHCR